MLSKDILILIGAGCSIEAKIPASEELVKLVEEFLIQQVNNSSGISRSENENKLSLYYLIKSCIFYSEGIIGRFNGNGNIEKIMFCMEELLKKEHSELYPFIGSWNPRLIEIGGYDFDDMINKLRNDIFSVLKKELKNHNLDQASYYEGFIKLSELYGHPLRVFSLNYDLCIEDFFRKIGKENELIMGFKNIDGKLIWNANNFDVDEEYNKPTLFLYKLHGSLDWERDNNYELIKKNHPVEKPELIFGTKYKPQYIDPYLYFMYQFSEYCASTNSLKGVIISAISGVIVTKEDIAKLGKQLLDGFQETDKWFGALGR